MDLIRQPLDTADSGLPEVELAVDRFKLQKRRWRGQASDGRDFGFDLVEPLEHGMVFFQSETCRYCIRQEPEPVLAIHLGANTEKAAQLGWQIGNLHMPMQVAGVEVRITDDPAVRLLIQGMEIGCEVREVVFQPVKGAIGSGHGHAHDHGIGHSHDHGHNSTHGSSHNHSHG